MHGVVGIGANLQLPLIEKLAPGQEWQDGPRGAIDEFMHASTPEAAMWANRLAASEGLLVGPSSGAAIKCAVEVAKRPEMVGKTVVVLQASSAIRYVSHPMWEAQKTEGAAALPIPPDLETEIPICRWRSEDYVPPPKD
jgi:cysteine synthase A